MTKKFRVTTYRGYSAVKGYISLSEWIGEIRSQKYARMISKIIELMENGRVNEANNVKKQLSFFTITACYTEKRLPESIACYNGLITIDIDQLTDGQVKQLRPVIEGDSATVACFLSARRHGYKILSHLNTVSAQVLRETYLSGGSITYEQLEKCHAQMYELTRKHYEDMLGVPVDTSGSDVSRGVYASFDPQAFFSGQRATLAHDPVTVIPAAPGEKTSAARRKIPAPVTSSPATGDIEPWVLMEFNKCVTATRRTVRYEEGNHNPFLFTLGRKCYLRKLDVEAVKRLAAQQFGEEGKWNTDEPIENGYIYVSKTEEAKLKKEEKSKVPAVYQVLDFLNEHYRFRRNTIMDRLEVLELLPGNEHTPYRTMQNKDFNTIYLHLCQAGIRCTQAILKAIIDSRHAREMNPFTDYFGGLSPWDGETDYIAQLADTVQTTDRDFWHDSFRRWLVGMVACATGAQRANQQVLLLQGEQGEGKSTWILNLLPPELREYYRSGAINPANRDEMLMLATHILINMEEFEGFQQGNLAELKRIITQESVTVRKPYEIQAQQYRRTASFIGTTNSRQFLRDIGGSRRFIIANVTEMDYRQKIDYEGVYSQAMHLIANGYRYWYEKKEIALINRRNEQYRMKDPVEENLYVYFQAATAETTSGRWRPAAAILSHLSVYGRTQANAQSLQILTQILERDGFPKRTNAQEVTEYAVVEVSSYDAEMKAR